jgi:hypothetical protein
MYVACGICHPLAIIPVFKTFTKYDILIKKNTKKEHTPYEKSMMIGRG